MKKARYVFLIPAIFALVFSLYCLKVFTKTESTESTLFKSFNYSGAKAVSSEIYLWGRLDEKRGGTKPEQVALNFSGGLGLINNGTFSKRIIENDLFQKVEIHGTTRDNILADVTVRYDKPENTGERTVSANLSGDMPNAGLEAAREKALKVFKKYSVNPKVNSCITGYFNGKLDNNRLNEVSKYVLKGVEARKVEGMRDDNLISVSAYTPILGDYIRVNGKRVNLNLAIRYSSYEDKTYIWLASPVITTEY